MVFGDEERSGVSTTIAHHAQSIEDAYNPANAARPSHSSPPIATSDAASPRAGAHHAAAKLYHRAALRHRGKQRPSRSFQHAGGFPDVDRHRAALARSARG